MRSWTSFDFCSAWCPWKVKICPWKSLKSPWIFSPKKRTNLESVNVYYAITHLFRWMNHKLVFLKKDTVTQIFSSSSSSFKVSSLPLLGWCDMSCLQCFLSSAISSVMFNFLLVFFHYLTSGLFLAYLMAFYLPPPSLI